MKAVPYISFSGNCEEAVTFYQSVIGGKLSIIKYSDMPQSEDMPVSETWKDKIMHCSITFDDGNAIFFGDTWEGNTIQGGDYSTIHLVVEKAQDVYDFVEKLSAGGEVTMPANETFWGSVYGSLSDKYGISWGVEFELK